MPLRPGTCTGVLLNFVPCESGTPAPNSPKMLSPQAHTVPSCFNANTELYPAEICFTPVSPGTACGVSDDIVVPLPSWPLSFLPHARTVPSVNRATFNHGASSTTDTLLH